MTAVVDLFCGAGGLSHGFRLEGFDVLAGIDIDETSRYAFEVNNDARFLRYDVTKMAAKKIRDLFGTTSPTVLVGCAPCQPFSSYSQKNENQEWQLVRMFGHLICEILPDIVSMENVPRLLRFCGGSVFRQFVTMLREAGYHVHWNEVFAPGYGIPQRRTRLVLLASRHGASSWSHRATIPPITGRSEAGDSAANRCRKSSVRSLPPTRSYACHRPKRMHTATSWSPAACWSSRPGRHRSMAGKSSTSAIPCSNSEHESQHWKPAIALWRTCIEHHSVPKPGNLAEAFPR